MARSMAGHAAQSAGETDEFWRAFRRNLQLMLKGINARLIYFGAFGILYYS